jgi:thiol-disulfide isomerase/thioredoxin
LELRGTVIDEHGAACIGVHVRLCEYGVDQGRTMPSTWDYEPSNGGVTTNEKGEFTLEGPNEGSVLIIVSDEDAMAMKPLVLEKDHSEPIRVVLRQGISQLIRIVDPEGNVCPGVELSALQFRDDNGETTLRLDSIPNVLSKSFISDHKGEILLPCLQSGSRVQALFVHADFAPSQTDLVVENGTAVREIVLQKGIPIELLLANGSPVLSDKIQIDMSPVKFDRSRLDRSLQFPTTGSIVQLCAVPGEYSDIWLLHPDYLITPFVSPNTVRDGAVKLQNERGIRFTIHLHRKRLISGKVTNSSTGNTEPGVEIWGSIENAGTEPFGVLAPKWMPTAGSIESQSDGSFSVIAASGKVRLEARKDGFWSRPVIVDVPDDESFRLPDLTVAPLSPVQGTIVDEQGQPISGAIVRWHGQLRVEQPVLTDDSGHFELPVFLVPVNSETSEPEFVQPLFAFHPHKPLHASAQIDLTCAEVQTSFRLALTQQKPEQLLEEMKPYMSLWERGNGEKLHALTTSHSGELAPELDGREWLNTEGRAKSLKDFRGKYVLLDFWTTWCGPCHFDFPTVRLVHQLYRDKVVVIGVHDNSVEVHKIREHVEKIELPFPIVIDHDDGRLMDKWHDYGVTGYPSYVLIDPEGRILRSSADRKPTLRTHKLEIIRELLLMKD